jgi:glucose/arabinose dehydrogenase
MVGTAGLRYLLGMGLRSTVLAAVVALAACRAEAPPAPPAPPAAAPTPKPQAPVAVHVTGHPVADGTWEVVLDATPERDVDALELTLPGRREVLRGVRAGETRRLVTRVSVAPGAGLDVAAGATTIVGAARRNRAALVRVGAPDPSARALAPARTVILPGGAPVAEVRP